MLRQGKAVEEGKHEELLRDQDGVYHGLVNAQALVMGKDELHEEDTLDMDLIAGPSRKFDRNAEQSVVLHSAPLTDIEDEAKQYKRQSFFASFGRLVYEQRTHWFLYSMVIMGALGAGVAYPL